MEDTKDVFTWQWMGRQCVKQDSQLTRKERNLWLMTWDLCEYSIFFMTIKLFKTQFKPETAKKLDSLWSNSELHAVDMIAFIL